MIPKGTNSHPLGSLIVSQSVVSILPNNDCSDFSARTQYRTVVPVTERVTDNEKENEPPRVEGNTLS